MLIPRENTGQHEGNQHVMPTNTNSEQASTLTPSASAADTPNLQVLPQLQPDA
jgi:hypothetical protein